MINLLKLIKNKLFKMYYIYNKCTVNRIKTCYSLYRFIRCLAFFKTWISENLIYSLFKISGNHIIIADTSPICWESFIIRTESIVFVLFIFKILYLFERQRETDKELSFTGSFFRCLQLLGQAELKLVGNSVTFCTWMAGAQITWGITTPYQNLH